MRINILGGSGLGKSTVAAWLFSELKRKHFSVESVNEYVKAWAVQQRDINIFDQNYIFAKQQQYEYRFLSKGIKNIVTDSPTMLPTLYTELYFGVKYAAPLRAMDDLYESEYPSFNLLLIREGDFVSEGRYQTSAEDAQQIDKLVLERLEEQKRDYAIVSRESRKEMLDLVCAKIDE